MADRANGRPDARRAQVRRHRRERQIIVFGVLLIAITFAGVFAAGVYKGDVEGPFSQAFVTPQGAFDSDITLVCPPSNSTPMRHSNVGVRILNGTDTNGLAGSVADDLDGRNYVVVSTENWGRTYTDYVRLYFGADGVRQAYTVALNFDGEVDMVLDNREGTLVDIVLGEGFAETGDLRSTLAPELDPDAVLSANAQCLPASLVTPEPAPRILPENPVDKKKKKNNNS
ncbi:LytR C-terminal domain-containing protein [Demequina sp. SYSU T00192]|uniref:LytR C-terminal domain-containing protein n=1 Tax=Demequina litoralis TaxID=3051660 RepID=A0ABT8G7Z1_9MICO|nr:LytR C-terminal domain-containing protein [Demequina sp. SYSU T00192]MDN4475261.1 LytR C-terminal domain-containing protein [Demequina sp. SYSU T00192]